MTTRRTNPDRAEGCCLTTCLCFSVILFAFFILIAVTWLLWDPSNIPYIPLTVGVSSIPMVIAIVLVIHQRARLRQGKLKSSN